VLACKGWLVDLLCTSARTACPVALHLQVKSLMKQLLAAVCHCHQRWVMHRDIKMSNLVCETQKLLFRHATSEWVMQQDI